MSSLSASDVLVCEKISKVLTILSENGSDLHDDTYLEKMISGFGKKMFELSRRPEPEMCQLFWSTSDVGSFIDANLSTGNENFCLKLLAECVQADSKVAEKGCQIVQLYSRFVIYYFLLLLITACKRIIVMSELKIK